MVPGDLSPQPGAIGIDAALERFNGLGMAPGYSVALPRGAMGVYSASVYPEQVSLQRVVHMDQYSGRILLDMGYADYGALGRGLEWGINVHLGQQYGTFNRLVLLVACAAIFLLCVSGAVMWWKRRPAGGIGIPPLPHAKRTVAIVFALLCIGGILFPLMGLSLLVIGVLPFWERLRRNARIQAALLGIASSNRAALSNYRSGKPIGTSRDQYERVGHLLGIHKNLRLLFPQNRDLAYRWMTTRNKAFDNRTPVEVVKEWGFAGLLMVRGYLDRARGV